MMLIGTESPRADRRFDELSPEQQTILRSAAAEESSFHGAAAGVKMSDAAARVALRRALKALATLYGKVAS